MDNPCYKCPERAFGCHSKCKRYTKWAAEHKALKEKENAERTKMYDANTYEMDKKIKFIKAKM